MVPLHNVTSRTRSGCFCRSSEADFHDTHLLFFLFFPTPERRFAAFGACPFVLLVLFPAIKKDRACKAERQRTKRRKNESTCIGTACVHLGARDDKEEGVGVPAKEEGRGGGTKFQAGPSNEQCRVTATQSDAAAVHPRRQEGRRPHIGAFPDSFFIYTKKK